MDIIEKKKERIQKKKEKILLEEKILKEKAKQYRARNFQKIGRLAAKADIDSMNEDEIFGAFLEIFERKNNEKNRDEWKEKTENFRKNRDKENNTPLAISFVENPKKEIKIRLREMNFQWNRFRKEFYGYGSKAVLSQVLKNCQYKVEVVD